MRQWKDGSGGFVSPSVLGWANAVTDSLYLGFDATALILSAGAILLTLGIPPMVLKPRRDRSALGISHSRARMKMKLREQFLA